MSEKNVNGFENAAKIYLYTISLEKLRSYGRSVGVASATAKKKNDLIEEIIGVLVGKIQPVEISKRGAPVKNDSVDQRVEEEMERLKELYLSDSGSGYAFDFEKEYKKMMERKTTLSVSSPLEKEEVRIGGRLAVFQGQLQMLNGVSMLLPLNCIENEEKIIMPVIFIKMHDLREGDEITCYAAKNDDYLVATLVLTVNGIPLKDLRRGHFNEMSVRLPTRRFTTYDGEFFPTMMGKYAEWLIQITEGQRGLVISSPKSGKTTALSELLQPLAALNEDVCVFCLLVDSSPETVSKFRMLAGRDRLVYSTYEDDPERQVFVADFILNRAKRYAESGRQVVLIVDSFNALARAYNDTEQSSGGKMLSCGLESKTVHYLKKYFGTARCLEKGGALTILGAVNTNTGNPADDVIGAELCALANLEIRLSDSLAYKRVFPALALRDIRVMEDFAVKTEKEKALDAFLHEKFMPANSDEELLNAVKNSKTKEEFVQAVQAMATRE